MFKHYYFLTSLGLHLLLLCFLIVFVDLGSHPYVFEQAPPKDTISAIVLGDTEKSHVLPKPKVDIEKGEHKQKTDIKIIQKESKLTDQNNAIPLKVKKIHQEKIHKVKPSLLENKNKLAEKKKEQKLAKNVQFEKKFKLDAEESLRKTILAEEQRLKNIKERMTRGEVDKFKTLLLQAIGENWIIPSGVDKSIYCNIYVRLSPNGEVLEARITKSSGNIILDRSARAAVIKASPLPVPKNPEAYAYFKALSIKVCPKDIVNNV